MRNLSATLAALAAAIFLGGCLGERTAGSTGVGNPTKGSVTVALVAVDSAPAAALAGPPAAAKAASRGGETTAASGNDQTAPSAARRNPDGSIEIRDLGGTAFTVRRGYANVGRIKIALPEGVDCSEADETECETGEARLDGPWVSDLMSGKWTPDPGAVRMPVGAYKRLSFRLEAQEKIAAGAPDMSRHSLVFGGTFAWNGRTDRPFSIALDFDEDAHFESAAAFEVDTGANALTVALDIGKWLANADITACLEKGDLQLDAAGGFFLEKGRGCEVEQDMKDAVKSSGNLRREREDGE